VLPHLLHLSVKAARLDDLPLQVMQVGGQAAPLPGILGGAVHSSASLALPVGEEDEVISVHLALPASTASACKRLMSLPAWLAVNPVRWHSLLAA
jgi:hypothetical protein